VAEVVLREEKGRESILLAPRSPIGKRFLKKPLEEQLLSEPNRDRDTKGTESSWSQCEIRLQQPLEFRKRLVVESDEVDVG
jgi:hypothetical protein